MLPVCWLSLVFKGISHKELNMKFIYLKITLAFWLDQEQLIMCSQPNSALWPWKSDLTVVSFTLFWVCSHLVISNTPHPSPTLHSCSISVTVCGLGFSSRPTVLVNRSWWGDKIGQLQTLTQSVADPLTQHLSAETPLPSLLLRLWPVNAYEITSVSCPPSVTLTLSLHK